MYVFIKTKFMDILNLRKISNVFILLIPIIVFSVLVLPLCFQNNDYLALVSSQFVDSGSILSSIFQLMDNDSLYNQNIPYHTAYGYPFNSILFWLFMVLKHIFKLSITTDFFIFATVARLANYVIAIFALCMSFLLAKKVFFRGFTVFLFLFFLSLFPPFILYTVQIKPDLLGVLFISCSMWFLLNFLENEHEKYLIIAFLFAGLAATTKQPFIYWIISLSLGAFWVNRMSLTKQALLIRFLRIAITSVLLFFPIFFIIHPYSFLDPVGLINKQIFLLNENASADMITNVRAWTMVIYENAYLLLLIFIPFISVLVPHKSELDKKRIILLVVYILVYIFWLIIKVGPMREPAYFLMIIVPCAFLVLHIYELVSLKISKRVLFLRISTFLVFSLTMSYLYYPHIQDNLDDIYGYKKSVQYQSVERIMQNEDFSDELLNSRVVFSASIPLPTHIMPQAVNTWQFGKGVNMGSNLIAYKPEMMIIDTFQWWEQPLEYWQGIAKASGLRYTKTLISDPNQSNKKVIIFMKQNM